MKTTMTDAEWSDAMNVRTKAEELVAHYGMDEVLRAVVLAVPEPTKVQTIQAVQVCLAVENWVNHADMLARSLQEEYKAFTFSIKSVGNGQAGVMMEIPDVIPLGLLDFVRGYRDGVVKQEAALHPDLVADLRAGK